MEESPETEAWWLVPARFIPLQLCFSLWQSSFGNHD